MRPWYGLGSIFILGLVLAGCRSTPTTPPAQQTDTTPVSIPLPPLVELPSGSFIMGDQTNQGDPDERPVQEMQISAFAISQFEVTFKEYDAFTKATGRQPAGDSGWGREQRPVISVSWQDAKAYTDWLTQKTGQTWRLPSEAEWEYAARAGLVSQYQSGNSPESVCAVGNVADRTAVLSGNEWKTTNCNDQAEFTVNVGSYRPNGYGLYDIHGNVWEWVADCYGGYGNPPPEEATCKQRVIRGGSFKTRARSARFSNREALAPEQSIQQVGFRVVKEL